MQLLLVRVVKAQPQVLVVVVELRGVGLFHKILALLVLRVLVLVAILVMEMSLLAVVVVDNQETHLLLVVQAVAVQVVRHHKLAQQITGESQVEMLA
jgi:hypothetical protein